MSPVSEMPSILHIVTRPNDMLAAEVIARQQTLPELEVQVADLTVRDPDYRKLLDQIFASDSVAVW